MFSLIAQQPPMVFCKKTFLEISQNSQENICARVSFLIKLQVSGLQLYLKRDSSTGVFLWLFKTFNLISLNMIPLKLQFHFTYIMQFQNLFSTKNLNFQFQGPLLNRFWDRKRHCDMRRGEGEWVGVGQLLLTSYIDVFIIKKVF